MAAESTPAADPPRPETAQTMQTTMTTHTAHTSHTAAQPSQPASDAAAKDDVHASHSSEDESEKKVATAESGGHDAPRVRSRGKIVIIMLALAMAVFPAAIDITIITTALPTISAHFHSTSGYTWIGSAYLLAVAASTMIWGKVSDIFGRKPVLLIANVVFFIGSLIAALSVNIGMLIVARAIQGIGGGGLVTLVYICIGDLFSPRQRGAYYGMIGGVWAIAGSLGPIVGGAFTQRVSWRWCFYINLPLDGAAFVLLLLFLDLKTPRTPFFEGVKMVDWTGVGFIVGGTLMFLFGISYGGETYPWDSATVICLIVFGFVSWVLFFVNEAYFAKYPLLPTRIFRYRSNWASLGVCFVQGLVFMGGAYYLPLYFQTVLGATPLLSGVYVLATTVSLSVGSLGTGAFISKTGQYLPPIYLAVFVMTLGYGLLIDLDAHSSWAKIIIYQIISGFGVGPLFQAPLIALQSLISPRDIATATAAFGFTRNLATAISIVLGQVVFQNEVSKRQGTLAAAVGPELAQRLGGGNAGANVNAINALPPVQREAVRNVFADSLSTAWIMYTCFSFMGIIVSLLIGKNKLSREHTETKTGLEAEREARAERLQEKQDRKDLKAHKSEV